MFRGAILCAIGSVIAGLAVLLGAFGAHLLNGILTEQQLGWFQTAVNYQFLHAFAVIIVGVRILILGPSMLSHLSALSFLAGVVFFCGSLYGLAFAAPRWFGAIAPLGGSAFLFGWALLALSFLKSVERSK